MKDKSYIIVKKRMGFFGFLDSTIKTILKVLIFLFVICTIGVFIALG